MFGIRCITIEHIKSEYKCIDIPKGTKFWVPFLGRAYSLCYELKGISSIWNRDFKVIDDSEKCGDILDKEF